MRSLINLKVEPFPVPSKVLVRAEPITLYPHAPAAPVAPPGPADPVYHTSMGVALEHLDVSTLEMLCDEFRREVMKKAGKTFPSAAPEAAPEEECCEEGPEVVPCDE